MRTAMQMTSLLPDCECADDFDWSIITEENHRMFLKWTHYLESSVTRLKINIKYYDKLLLEYILERNFRQEYNVFLTITINNICSVIAIEFSKIFGDRNALDLTKYLDFCKGNFELIFSKKDVSLISSLISRLDTLKERYKKLIKEPRNKVFAHSDDVLIKDENKVSSLMSSVSISDFEQLIEGIKDVLNSIWQCYRNKKLWFKIDGDDDIDKLLEKISS